jgi:L-cysteine S-thiosulfotransferase
MRLPGTRNGLLLAGLAWLMMLAGGVVLSEVLPSQKLKSGFETMGPDARMMQRDDSQNPAMLWVREGERMWHEKPEGIKQSCAGCHGDATISMRSIAARYPAFDETTQRPIDLTGRIQQCRTLRQEAPELAREGRQLLALSAYVGLQSRGTLVRAPIDARLAQATADGNILFNQRLGQLNLSCAQCHDDQAGKRLGGSLIPQGHANGYPLYRLEWQSLGSLQRRLRNCLTGVRAEPFAYGDPVLINLELYLNSRGAGLEIETPAVRP